MSGTDPRAGQEAARLLAAAQDWLRTSAPHLAPLAEDGEPCSCPVCRVVAGVRDADPDTVGRWVDTAVTAVTSLAAQLAEQSARAASGDADDEPADRADARAARFYDELDDGSDTDGGPPEDDVPEDDGPEFDEAWPRTGSPVGPVLVDGTRQDGPRPRGVRRIPLEHDDDPAPR